jgi:hypothetical protein
MTEEEAAACPTTRDRNAACVQVCAPEPPYRMRSVFATSVHTFLATQLRTYACTSCGRQARGGAGKRGWATNANDLETAAAAWAAAVAAGVQP